MKTKLCIKEVCNIFKKAEIYQGFIEEKYASNSNDCIKLTYHINTLTIDITKVIDDINEVFDHQVLNKKCDGVLISNNGKLILVELKTNPISKCKTLWKQIIASYISACALLYTLFPEIKNFDLEIIIAGCRRKKDIEDIGEKLSTYTKDNKLISCIELVKKEKLH